MLQRSLFTAVTRRIVQPIPLPNVLCSFSTAAPKPAAAKPKPSAAAPKPAVTAPKVATPAENANDVKYSIALHPYNLLSKTQPLNVDSPNFFAVVALGGTQYKVTKDDTFVVSLMEGVDIGQIIDLENVLLVGSQKGTAIGRPVVPGAKVKVAVEEITKDKKVTILKFRRRKNSKRKRGFRRDVCVLRVVDIIPPEDAKDHL